MKLLLEKRTKLIEEIEQIMEKAEKETRAFNSEELEKVNGLKESIHQIDVTIKAKEEARNLMTSIKSTTPPTNAVSSSITEEIRSLKSDQELEIGARELRDKTNAFSLGAIGSGNSTSENIAKTTFAEYILDKLAYVSPLYGAVRHERFGNSKHQIPVQANKLGKFVPMKELAKYSKQVADFVPIKLEAHKFGTLISFSQEALDDTGYNLESELLRQLSEAYSMTLDELVAKGSPTEGIEGLESFNSAADGSHTIQISQDITTDDIVCTYFKLPIRYRNSATWVISDEVAKIMTKLKDEEGKPLLIQSYNGAPFGQGCTLLGRPVIINEHITKVYFGDLQRALIVGERKSLSLQKSTEYGFINDEVAIKANMRLDIKKALGEAMVVGTIQQASTLSARKKSA